LVAEVGHIFLGFFQEFFTVLMIGGYPVCVVIVARKGYPNRPLSIKHMATCPASSDVVLDPLNVDGVPLYENTSKLTFRVRWSAAASTAASTAAVDQTLVDLDLSAVLFDSRGNATELVSHFSPVSSDAARTVALVTGDQRSGDIGETIVVRLANLSSDVAAIGFLMTCPDTKVSITDVQQLHLTATSDDRMHGDQSPTSWAYCCMSSDDAQEHRRRDPIHMRMVASVQRAHGGGSNVKTKNKKKECNGRGGDWVLRAHRSLMYGLSARDAAAEMAVLLGYCSTASESHVSFPFPLYLDKGQCFDIPHSMSSSSATVPHQRRRADHNSHPVNDTVLTVGVGWDVAPRLSDGGGPDDASSDIDLSCVAMNVHEHTTQDQIKDMLYWGKITGLDGAVTHSGDNTDGEGEGLDEFLTVNLSRIPHHVNTLAFVVSSYNKPTLDAARHILFSVSRSRDEGVLVLMEGIGSGGSYSSFIPCVLERYEPLPHSQWSTASIPSTAAPQWRVRVLSLPVAGHSVSDEETRASICATVVTSARGSAGTDRNAAILHPIHIRRAAETAHQRRRIDASGSSRHPLSSDTQHQAPSLPRSQDEPSKLVIMLCLAVIVVVAAYVLKMMGL
jgi:stress response protein SCP2